MRYICVSIFCILSYFCCGCSTVMTGGGYSQAVKFQSEPPGATVTIDGNYIGMTPLETPLTRNEDHDVQISLSGYSVKQMTLGHGLSKWFLWNIIFPGFWGMIVDACDGAVTTVDSTKIDVNFIAH